MMVQQTFSMKMYIHSNSNSSFISTPIGNKAEYQNKDQQDIPSAFCPHLHLHPTS